MSPGKFQGNDEWVEEFWDSSLSGDDDGNTSLNDGFYCWFKLSTDDAKSWPDLKGIYGIILHETSDGFIDAETYETFKGWHDAVGELEEMAAGDDDDDDDDDDEIESDPFTYWIDHDERGDFRASVNNPTGETVFAIVDYDIFEDGFMKDKHDLSGLKEYLVSLNIMNGDDSLVEQR